MPILTQDQAIEQYYESVKDQYPDIDFQTFSTMCRTPSEFIKHCIRQDNIPIIHVKYLGKIRTYRTRLKRIIYIYTKRVALNKDTPEIRQAYIDTIDYLCRYMKHLDEYDKKEINEEQESG